MLATLLSATLVALDGRVIRVEVDVAPGLPGFTIVGLGDASIREARERVRGAIRNAGFVHPPRRITVNLAPARVDLWIFVAYCRPDDASRLVRPLEPRSDGGGDSHRPAAR
ncbi:MAG: hypothetical protein FIA92_07730 [Chloroflexi bacterium]|nr:hypothetical protein [Chloroflexota bacterium]